MIKILKIVVTAALLSSSLLADLARVEMGAGVWQSESQGEASYSSLAGSGLDQSIVTEESNPYLWVLIKHPIPILPNLRLEYTDVTRNGIANGTFEDFTASNSRTRLELTQYDVIPYYNILDNTAWTTLDLGLDIKLIDTKFKADGVVPTIGLGATYEDSVLLAIPLLYTRVRVEIPATNIGLEADAKYVTYSDSTVYDLRVKVDYTLDFIPVIKPAVEVGYRHQRYKIDDADLEGKMDIEFSGFYAGAMLRF